MLTVTAAEFQRHFGRYQDEALIQPVTITRNGRARLVMISAEEYERLARKASGDKNSDNKRNVKKRLQRS
jgi:prevent-host-death family protein